MEMKLVFRTIACRFESVFDASCRLVGFLLPLGAYPFNRLRQVLLVNTRCGWLTDHHRNWGFGLCCPYMHNVKGFGWSPQTRVPHLPGVGIEPTHQAQEAPGA